MPLPAVLVEMVIPSWMTSLSRLILALPKELGGSGK